MASLDSAPRVAYRGFISYGHRDGGIGKSIHRRLEAYRLPARLIGSETALGPVPARLTPIFRDREELSAGESLSDQVQAALIASDCLIVLCSPNAKASKWVAKEIETFRTLHPDRPVLAALIVGEPEDAFPESLTADGAEPIAADFRKGGDGQKLALLKLIAGMTAIPLDSLVQRDAQRQMRRVMAVTLAALLAVLAMALLLVMAVRAEREAKRQRQQAEGLVEYMLTDLRDRLKGVGRLDVMTAVNERAMGYYGAQGDLSALPPESLDRRARILHAMGEDDEKRGNFGQALSKFEEAHRATEAVLAQKPGDPNAIFAHAQSEFWVGEAAWRKSDRAMTTRHWQGYLTQAQQLAKIQPGSKRTLMEMGYAEGNFCDLNMAGQHNLQAALESCVRSLKYENAALKLAPNDSEVRRALSNRHGWMANVLHQLKRYDEALRHRDSELALLNGMVRQDASNADLKIRIVWCQKGRAAALQALDRHVEALQELDSALASTSALISFNPDDLDTLETKTKLLALKARSERAVGREGWSRTIEIAEGELSILSNRREFRKFVSAMVDELASVKQEDGQ